MKEKVWYSESWVRGKVGLVYGRIWSRGGVEIWDGVGWGWVAMVKLGLGQE